IRKGEKVVLSWTAPKRTTDNQPVETPGVTRICRSQGPAVSCQNFVGEIPGGAAGAATSYTDTLSADLIAGSAQVAGYAVEPLNPSGRSAGLSNQVVISLAQTLPPPADFKTQVVPQGIQLSWTCPLAPPGAGPGVSYRLRVYRRPEDVKKELQIAV